MANLPIKSPAEFTSEVYQRQRRDFITADLENQIAGQLLNNDIYLLQKQQAAELAAGSHEGNSGIHVTAEQKQEWSAEATQSRAGKLSAADKRKLDGVASGAEANQNAFSTVTAGGVSIAANGKTANVNLVAGSNVTITGDNANKRVTVSANLPATMPPSAHTHTKGQITDFPAAIKNPAALTVSLNGASQGAYDGSSAKSINITPSGIGAAASSHFHPAESITGGVFAANVSVPAGTDYAAAMLRNARFSTSVPAALDNGEICFVYE